MQVLIMPNQFHKRFNDFLESHSIPIKEIAAKIEVSYQSAHQFLSGKTKPKMVTLALLAEAYPELNMNWLLTGRGGMEIGQDEKSLEIDSLKEQLKTCQEKSKLLSEMVEKQNFIIDLLKKSQAS